MATQVNIDLETSSLLDLTRVGVHVYAAHPSTRVLCMAYKIDDAPEALWWNHEPFPQVLAEALESGAIAKAWNAAFERNMWPVLTELHGAPEVPLRQWSCTMVRALMQGFPGQLQHAGPVMGLGVCKDDTGHRVMLQLCKPRQRWKRGGKGWDTAKELVDGDEYQLWSNEVVRWWRDEGKSQVLGDYCKMDVVVEHAADKFLDQLPAEEQEAWFLDQQINDRGFHVDMDLVRDALDLVKPATQAANRRLFELSGGELTHVTKPNDIRGWLNQKLGIELDSISKDVLSDLMVTQGDSIPADAKAIIDLRLAAAKTSTAKLNALSRGVGEDDRFRGGLQFAGAGRTNRYAGRRAQIQNFPRPPGWALDAIPWVQGHDVEAIELAFGNALEAISAILRSCISAGPGKELIFADYNAIEVRMVAWLCDAPLLLKAFRNNEDTYRIMAAELYNVPNWRDIPKDSFERFLGKTVVLGCFAEDTPVLTKRGPVRIVDLLTSDKVWDGEEWVCHQGVVYRGLRGTLRLCGVSVTPDHLVWSGTKWKPASSLVRDGSILSQALGFAAENLPSPDTFRGHGEGSRLSSSSATVVGRSTPWIPTISKISNLPGATSVLNKHPAKSVTGSMRTPCLMMSTGRGSSTAWQQPLQGVKTQTIKNSGIMGGAGLGSTLSGSKTDGRSYGTSRPLKGGTSQNLSLTGSTTTGGTSQETSGSLPEAKTCSTEDQSQNCKTKLHVYDVSFAGPRNRFTILTDEGPLIVHNCGYGMGHKRFRESCKEQGQYISGELSKHAVDVYRSTNSAIPRGWYNLDDASKRAMKNPQQWAPALGGKVHFWYDGRMMLRLRLPSGRLLTYLHPRLIDDVTPWGSETEKFQYWGWNGQRNRMEWIDMFGGKWLENCLAEGSEVLTNSGWKPIEEVTLGDKVHDGVEFVTHGGSIYSGEHNCTQVDGVQMTPDHEVLTNDGWQAASLVSRPFRPEIREPTGKPARRHQPGPQGNGGSEDHPGIPMAPRPVYDIADAGPRQRFVVRGDEGPFIVHNCSQAASRDLLQYAMTNLEGMGYPIILSVHDEVGAEVDKGTADLPHFSEVMATPPPWAADLPLKVEGWVGHRYRK